MTLTPTIVRFAVLAAFVSAASASPVGDPAMGLDDGSLSSPISEAFFTPMNGGGVFDFFNDTARTITLLTFDTTVLPGLSADQLAEFVCNDANTPGHPNKFFVNCAITYTSSNGFLEVSFSGTDARHPGILPADSNCQDTGQVVCGQGHFFVTLNDGFSLDPAATGGWNDPALVGNNPIHFGVAEIQSFGVDIPEPSTLWLAAGAIGVLGALKFKRKNRAA